MPVPATLFETIALGGPFRFESGSDYGSTAAMRKRVTCIGTTTCEQELRQLVNPHHSALSGDKLSEIVAHSRKRWSASPAFTGFGEDLANLGARSMCPLSNLRLGWVSGETARLIV